MRYINTRLLLLLVLRSFANTQYVTCIPSRPTQSIF